MCIYHTHLVDILCHTLIRVTFRCEEITKCDYILLFFWKNIFISKCANVSIVAETRLLSCSDICQCGNPPSVTNANRNPSSGPYNCGTTVSYSCFSGYNLQGNNQLRCNSNSRQWDGSTPFCQRGLTYFQY